MTLDDLQVLVRTEADFRKAFRKTNSEVLRGQRIGNQMVIDNAPVKNEVVDLIKNNFGIGRMPCIHQVVLPDGSQIRLKFYDTVKKLYNSKNKELPGKESYLSYLEVTVMPIGLKGYMFTVDVEQIVWKDSRSKAEVIHKKNLAELTRQAEELGIDLSVPGAWCTTYTENF